MAPRYGLLAGGVPLPPRRPPGVGSDGADLPTLRGVQLPKQDIYELLRRDIDEQARGRAERQQKGMAELGELKQDYPYGSGFPETSPSFPRPEGQWPLSEMNQRVRGPGGMAGAEDTRHLQPWPLPGEYQPDRPIPLGELQRRWGVPRLEDL
jgi:hypothetical protein